MGCNENHAISHNPSSLIFENNVFFFLLASGLNDKFGIKNVIGMKGYVLLSTFS